MPRACRAHASQFDMLVVESGARGQEPLVGGCGTVNGDLRMRQRHVLCAALTEGRLPVCMPLTVQDIAARLEMCALVHARAQADVYLSCLSRMVFNLKHNGSSILAGYPLSRICRLSHRRMHAETAHAVRDATMDAKVQQLLADAKAAAEDHTRRASEKKSSHAIRCPRCKTQTGIVRTARQTRAADEGMTTTCLCMSCSWSWSLRS